MVKLQEHKNKFSITIPKDLISKLGWSKGEKLFLQKERDVLIIEKL